MGLKGSLKLLILACLLLQFMNRPSGQEDVRCATKIQPLSFPTTSNSRVTLSWLLNWKISPSLGERRREKHLLMSPHLTICCMQASSLSNCSGQAVRTNALFQKLEHFQNFYSYSFSVFKAKPYRKIRQSEEWN